MASIKIATGIKKYDIEDENGDVRGQISINPSDTNIYPRALLLIERVQGYAKQLDSVETDDEAIKAIEDIDKKIKEEINILFDDAHCSEVLFGNQNCFNTLNGVTFVERVLSSIIPIIQKDTEAERKKSEKRIDKYVNQVK